MKLKMYLRGLGIGMAVTALVISLGNQKPSMSDEEIIARAIQLGMVENRKLADTKQTQSQEDDESKAETEEDSVSDSDGGEADMQTSHSAEEDNKNAADSASRETTSSESVEKPTDNKSVDPTDKKPDDSTDSKSNESARSTQETKSAASGENVTITVKRGDNSWTVSKTLAGAGLISDAGEYDKYLCDEGYSKNICVGTYEITMGATQEEIAKIITKKN